MSVLIKDMEMPSNCDSCRIMVFEDTNCVEELYCGCPIVFKVHPQGVDHRPDYCPLVPVPPHGRLIDADVMRTRIDASEDIIRLLVQWIDAQGTVIPASEEEMK